MLITPARYWAFVVAISLALSVWTLAQVPEGRAAFDKFDEWRNQPVNAALDWSDALDRYREHLLTQGSSPEQADRLLRLVLAHDEGTFYDKVYAAEPQFQTEPNRLLMEVADQLKPGKALDVGMGQGRNALSLLVVDGTSPDSTCRPLASRKRWPQRGRQV